MSERAVGKHDQAIVISTTPDVCWTPQGAAMVAVPYTITCTFDVADRTAPRVLYGGQPAFTVASRLPLVRGDEAGSGGGLVSGVSTGYCRAVTHSESVRAHGSAIVRNGDVMEMNCDGPDGPGNTRGRVVYTSVVRALPVAPSADASHPFAPLGEAVSMLSWAPGGAPPPVPAPPAPAQSKGSAPAKPAAQNPGKRPGGHVPKPLSHAEQVARITACDGGVLADAALANDGYPVDIVEGIPSNGWQGEANLGLGKVTIKPDSNTCIRMQVMLFELINYSNSVPFAQLQRSAMRGEISRAEYVRGAEKIEYDGIKRHRQIYERCAAQWGCKKVPWRWDGMQNAKDFDDYFDHYLAEAHKEYHGGNWDRLYRAAYQHKHPTPPTGHR